MQTTSPIRIKIPDETLELVYTAMNYCDQHLWIPWAWSVLARDGYVEAELEDDDDEYPSHLFALASLSHLFDRFQDIYAGVDGDDDVEIDLIDDDRPGITQIELGRYCESNGYFDDSHFPETASGLTRAAILSRTDDLRRRLNSILGEGRLFTSLSVAGGHVEPSEEEEFGYPPTPLGELMTVGAFDTYSPEVLNFDFTDEKQRAFAWLKGDLDLD